MKNLNVGDRVIVIENREIKKGAIKNTYYALGVVIVEFDDGSVAKAPVTNVAFEPKAESTAESEAQEKREGKPTEKSEITITPDEFRDIAIEVLSRETADNPLVGVVLTPILVKIGKALFSDKESENSDNVE